MYVSKQNEKFIRKLGDSFHTLLDNLILCGCGNFVDCDGKCNICNDPTRDFSSVCVIPDIPDLLAIEDSHEFKGRYAVLHGLIDPMNGVGPGDIKLKELLEYVRDNPVNEVILALGGSIEADATSLFLVKTLKAVPHLTITQISYGVSVGADLSESDPLSLRKALQSRTEL
jgi:recombination protein RecR